MSALNVTIVIIVLLLLIIIYEAIVIKYILKSYEKATNKITSGNFIFALTANKKINKILEPITKKLILWVYNTLKSSTHISEQVKQVYKSCDISIKTSEDIKNKFKGFDKKSKTALSYLEELNSLSKETYESQKNIYDLSKNALETSNNTGKYIEYGSESVENAIRLLDHMNLKINDLGQYVGNLSNIVEEVNNMAQLITQLSSNINMLSLNASIEAARAGEHGKGFAVVAAQIGRLADESAQYSKVIKDNTSKVDVETKEMIDTMDFLSKKREETQESTISIKNYFNYINKEILNIISSVHIVSEKVEEGLRFNNEIKESSTNIAQFFEDFTNDLEIINKQIEYQYSAEKNNMKSCDIVNQSIEKMSEFTQEFENIVANKLIDQCRIIAKKLVKKELDENNISEYCKQLGISEVYITDNDGVTTITNNIYAKGFKFSDDKDSQAYVFRRILKDKTLVVTQNFQKRDLDNKYFKYIGISRIDSSGIVQVGLNIDDILSLKL